LTFGSEHFAPSNRGNHDLRVLGRLKQTASLEQARADLGTNSHDRLLGAAGVLRSLRDRGAIELITTHDLALTTVADQLSPSAANVHFQDWFEGNDIRLHYLMKPGPVTRSNALALTRAVGLDVPITLSSAVSPLRKP
jgi:DNA mismatch repair ATPase MutS